MPPRRDTPPPSLSSLPTEILTQIVQLLPRSSAISFARVARRFALPAEHRIWKQLDLFLHPNFGEQPLVQTHERSGHGAHLAWAKAEARKAEDRHREGLREKVKRIMIEGSGRRFGMVEKVVVIPRPGAITNIVGLLDMVSPGLQTLEIDAPATHVFAGDWAPSIHETIDAQIVNCKLLFPALTHLRIHEDVVRISEFIYLLLEAAPNLVHLDVDAQGSIESAERDELDVPAYPSDGLTKATNLLDLRLAFGNDWDYNLYELAESIVSSSPKLQRASLIVNTDGDPYMDQAFLEHFGALQELQVLHISGYLFEIRNYLDELAEGGGSFPSLRRLVVNQDHALEFFEDFPSLPAVQTVYLQQSDALAPTWPAGTDFPPPTLAPSMLPSFAAILRNSPSLRDIYLLPTLVDNRSNNIFSQIAEIDKTHKPMGVVRSLKHGEEELHHARVFVRYRETSDGPYKQGRIIATDALTFEYETEDEVMYEKVYELRSGGESGWLELVDFGGRRVPIEIIERMRLAAGAKIGDWEGRGIEVGAAAWAVLTGWRDEEVAEEKRKAAAEAKKKNAVTRRTIVINSSP